MASPKRQSLRKSIAHFAPSDAAPGTADKENHTADLDALQSLKSATQIDSQRSERKTRSKSLGPGGLDALKDGSGNRRKTTAQPPRSILKPSVPLSPLREIPSRGEPANSTGKSSPAATPQQTRPSPSNTTTLNSPRRSPFRTGLSPEKATTPTKTQGINSPKTSGGNGLNDQQTQDEAREKRRKEREAIQQQREARRKSMANRRVSFAPEATLHTWDHVEDMQDSTTSSASTDPTRRASNATDVADEAPSTPDQAEQHTVEESPAHQPDLNQKQRRRKSSGIPPMNFDDPLDMFSSSPYVTGTVNADHGDDSESSSPEKQTTSPAASNSQPQVASDEVDENGEMTMEMVDDDVTAAFKPWARQIQQNSQPTGAKLAVNADQENINPFSPAFQRGASIPRSPMPTRAEEDNGDMSMDITRVVGGITAGQKRQSTSHQSLQSSRRQSIMRVQNSSSDSNNAYGSDTMDLTAVIGGIKSNTGAQPTRSSLDQNEELSMEFTSVFGGIQGTDKRKSIVQSEEASGSSSSDFDNLQSTKHRLDADGDTEMTMDFDDIVSNEGGDTAPSVQIHEVQEAKEAEAAPEAVAKQQASTESLSTSKQHLALPGASNVTPTDETPSKQPQTPSKQLTPKPTRPITPTKSPTPKNVTMRTPSPRKLFRSEIKQSNQSSKQSPSLLPDKTEAEPLSPANAANAAKLNASRRISGVGFDKQGLGSPQVADLLDRRASIGEEADVFAPQRLESRGVHFDNPRTMNAEVVKDREQIERRESGQFVMEEDGAELEEKDTTTTLKEAIGSMTPKKNKFKGRKSLATGSAKGLLGKRPAELDEEDEGTPQGLKGRQASPVKKIKLQAPPTASETTGRAMMARRSLGPGAGISRPYTPVNGSPVKKGPATTPSHKGHFKDAEALPGVELPLPLGSNKESEGSSNTQDQVTDKMHLQEFLNLTNIRFMELNTTRRRHTAVTPASKASKDPTGELEQDPVKFFADAVVAGACTLPMLELFQHSCRELKKYISDGRKIVREIETNTYEENPALFREYTSAAPQARAVMDNQFKNMKTHARLLSKGMWYEWRMKLLEGLKDGLVEEASGLQKDKSQLNEQASAIDEILPSLIEEHKTLEKEFLALQAKANELANCDQGELRDARQQILSIDEQIRLRRQQFEKLQARSVEMDTAIEDASDAKTECLEAIKEAEKMLSEYRGWSADEVNNLKANVDALEKQSGWSVVSSSSTQLTMTYRGQLQLSFDIAAFQPATSSSNEQTTSNAPIRLSYIADQDETYSEELTTEKRFFLQLMQAHLQSLEQSKTQIKSLFYFVSATWTQALALSEEIRRLGLENLTKCNILSDERLAVRASMLLPTVETKVHVFFELGVGMTDMDVVVKLKTRAEVVYGEQYREEKMRDFVKARIGEGASTGGSWADAFRELKSKLIARGRK